MLHVMQGQWLYVQIQNDKENVPPPQNALSLSESCD